MAEWSNAPDSKSGIRFSRIEGSNPSFSAKYKNARASGLVRHLRTHALWTSAPASRLIAGAAGHNPRVMPGPAPFRCTTLAGLPALPGLLAAITLALLPACASRSVEIAPKPTDPARYALWACDRLSDEIDAVQQQAADVAYAVDSRAGNNLIALGLGVTVFWPALLAMRPDGPEAAELADLKGRFEALRSAAAAKACAPPGEAMAAQRQASLPVAIGDRLVYDDRVAGQAQTLVMQVSGLRREQIEFKLQVDGRWLDKPWRQDLAGNSLLDGPAALIAWRRLLKPGLVLGQVVSGELAGADEQVASARVRGQVVAIGPQTVAGRDFDVAVIELFGEAPSASSSPGAGSDGSTRLDGVMAVDRQNGLLLRLDLRCANPMFALRRRLQRIEAATP